MVDTVQNSPAEKSPKINLAETSDKIGVSSNINVAEVIATQPGGNNTGDGDQTAKQTAATFSEGLFSNKIRRLIQPLHSSAGNASMTMQKQRQIVGKALHLQVRKLNAQAAKIMHQAKFNASKLEIVAKQMRYLRSLLNELVRATASRIAELYRIYVSPVPVIITD